MEITFENNVLPQNGTVILGVDETKKLPPLGLDLDSVTGGALQRALDYKKFTGKKNEVVTLIAPHGTSLSQILVVGLGKNPSTSLAFEEFGGTVMGCLMKCKDEKASVILHSDDLNVAHAAYGALLRSWRFDKYKTKQKKEDQSALKALTFLTNKSESAQKDFAPLSKIAEGVFLTRRVVSEPANIIYPETMMKEAQQLKDLGLKIDVLAKADMEKLGMNALLGVGQGSIRDSYLVVLHWEGSSEAPVAVVGKGVTFDTGGISIKPSQNMDEMKYDMAGSGVVLGLMKSLAQRKAKVNVVGVMGLVENMPSGSAQRPGDIVTSMSGQTIEVLNTDAEGRLVLADALWYTQDRFKPKAMIDLATLTGAIVVSLGHEHAGLFSNNDELATKLLKAGEKTGEKLWRLPLADAYDKDIDSSVADVQNIGSGRGAGSITAAHFLKRFVNDVPWAHLDIAGTAWDKKSKPLCEKGATAFGVRLLNQYLMDNFEK